MAALRRTAWLWAAIALLAGAGCQRPAERVYRRAELFLAAGRHKLAAEEYQRIADKYASDPLADDALYKLGYLRRVYLHDPAGALEAYRRLARRYPASPYADEALLWQVYIYCRQLKQAGRAEEVCRQIDGLYPRQKGLRARAWLLVARAYSRQGELERAAEIAERVASEFGDEAEQAAWAWLLLGRIAARRGDAKRATECFEKVIRAFGETYAAAQAKRELGLLYYAGKKAEQAQRLAELKRQRRVFDVPEFGASRDERLCMFGALASLLRRAGVDVDGEVLAAWAGASALPRTTLGGEAVAIEWGADPLQEACRWCGAVASVWYASSAEQGWEAVRQALLAGQPALVCFDRRWPWIVVRGYLPVEGQVLVAIPGGKRRLSVGQLKSRWRPASEVASYLPAPAGKYYVLAVAGVRERKSGEVLAAEALGRVAQLLQEASLGGALKEWAAAAEDPARRGPKLARAAAVQLGRWVDARRSLAAFLKKLPGGEAAAAQAEQSAELVGAAAQAMAAAGESEGAEQWRRAAELLRQAAQAEEELSFEVQRLARQVAAQ